MKLCFYKLIINNFLLKYKSDKITLLLNKKIYKKYVLILIKNNSKFNF